MADAASRWREVGALLSGRPGWSLEAQASPGAPRLWCFGAGGHHELSVGVDGGGLDLYLVRSDEDLFFDDTAGLRTWLEEHEPIFVERSAAGRHDVDRLLADLLGEWRPQRP